MTLIIGLGNPGEKFKNTRHNVGFMAIDEFAGKNNFPEFKISKKFNSLISESILNEEKIILAKPQTFMNESGKAVRELTKPYASIRAVGSTSQIGLNPKPLLIVIHDDIDLAIGKIKISIDRGSAGHKGVESIIKELKTKDFIRLRIGIQPPQTRRPVYGTEKFVLQKFSKEEKEILNKAIKDAISAIEITIKEGVKKAMNEYNK